MAIEIRQNKQSNLGGLIIFILVLVIGGWLAWSFLKPIDLFQKPKIEDLLPSSVQELISAELNVSQIFNHPVFYTLTAHVVWPLEVPQLGRKNPFNPF
ncbi:MAG: hypothetical protein PHH35_00025 [Candidatus Pacebacteria bacterium]|nr:hypothetical protein [Candidatus Paceibacterota bacterium]